MNLCPAIGDCIMVCFSILHVVMLRVLLCCVYIVILVLVSLALLILLVFLVRGNYYNIYFL